MSCFGIWVFKLVVLLLTLDFLDHFSAAKFPCHGVLVSTGVKLSKLLPRVFLILCLVSFRKLRSFSNETSYKGLVFFVSYLSVCYLMGRHTHTNTHFDAAAAGVWRLQVSRAGSSSPWRQSAVHASASLKAGELRRHAVSSHSPNTHSHETTHKD